jgi:hypothetical protein
MTDLKTECTHHRQLINQSAVFTIDPHAFQARARSHVQDQGTKAAIGMPIGNDCPRCARHGIVRTTCREPASNPPDHTRDQRLS